MQFRNKARRQLHFTTYRLSQIIITFSSNFYQDPSGDYSSQFEQIRDVKYRSHPEENVTIISFDAVDTYEFEEYRSKQN